MVTPVENFTNGKAVNVDVRIAACGDFVDHVVRWFDDTHHEYEVVSENDNVSVLNPSFQNPIANMPDRLLKSDSVDITVFQESVDYEPFRNGDRFTTPNDNAPFSYDPAQDFYTEPDKNP